MARKKNRPDQQDDPPFHPPEGQFGPEPSAEEEPRLSPPAEEQAAPSSSTEAVPADPVHDFTLTPAPADPPALPLASVAPAGTPEADAPRLAPAQDLAPLEDRLRRLEQTLARLEQLQGTEQRVVEHLANHIQTAPPAQPVPPPASVTPSILGAAGALVTAGRSLLPSLAQSGPAVTAASSTRPGAGRGWLWLFRDMLAELQAMVYVYTDPRYRLSWASRVVAPALAVAFVTCGWWLPYVGCGLGALFIKPVELILCYLLLTLLGHEARRYRETAPDLPPNLRL